MSDLEPGWTPRPLSDGERSELRAIAARARRFPRRLGLMTATIALVLARILVASPGPSSAVLALFGGVVLLTAWGRWRRARALGARFHADADGGWVARGPEALEVLPSSGARWTEGGAAAGWRARAVRR